MPQYVEKKKEHANSGVEEDLKEIIVMLFFSTVIISSNALFISCQALPVPAFFEVLCSSLNRWCMKASRMLRSF